MRQQSHHKNQYLDAKAREFQTGIRTCLFKSGQFIVWTTLQGNAGFPACLGTSEDGWLSRRFAVQVWAAGRSPVACGAQEVRVDAWQPLWSQQICKETSWPGAEESRAVMTDGERTQLEITCSLWPIPGISPVEASTKRWLQRQIYLKYLSLVGLALITQKGAQRLSSWFGMGRARWSEPLPAAFSDDPGHASFTFAVWQYLAMTVHDGRFLI